MRSFEAIRGHLRSKWPILFSIATTSRLWTGTFLPRFLRTWIRYWQMDCCAMFLLISCSVENRRIFKNDRSADCQLTGQYMSKVIYIDLYGFDGYQNEREACLISIPVLMSHIDDVITKLWRHYYILTLENSSRKLLLFVHIVSRFLSISNLFQTQIFKFWCHFRSYGHFRFVKNIIICRTGVIITWEPDSKIAMIFSWDFDVFDKLEMAIWPEVTLKVVNLSIY